MGSLHRPWEMLHGHLGDAVSALVDGQLDAPTAERAWAHVDQCPACSRLVEHEGWVKRQLASIAGCPGAGEPSDRLVGSLRDLEPAALAWAASTEMTRALEDRGRHRRRAGLVLVGAGSVSAAVLGLSALGGAPLAPGGSPAASLGGATAGRSPTAGPSNSPVASFRFDPRTPAPVQPVVAPTTTVHGRLPGFVTGRDGVARAFSVANR